MDAATLFAIGIGIFAALDITFRLAEGISRLAGNIPWLARRAGDETGVRDDFYVFYNIRDLIGPKSPKAGVRPRVAPAAPRPRPRAAQV